MRFRAMLFDIDGTLLRSGGAGRRSMEEAFLQVLEVEDALSGISLAGWTDRELVRHVLVHHRPGLLGDVEREEGVAREVFAAYGLILERVLRDVEGFVVLEGVRETLEWLSMHKPCLVGVATGNVRQGAALKLQRGGLEGYFALGGYGEDGPFRADMLRKAGERVDVHLGGVELREILVLGDTVRDIDAARQAGMSVGAVATGGDAYEVLEERGPDFLWRSMGEVLGWMQKEGQKWGGD